MSSTGDADTGVANNLTTDYEVSALNLWWCSGVVGNG
jgi:hypothetical protein